MLLAIDLRNRELSFGFRSGGEWLLRARAGASHERSADEYALFIESALARMRSRNAPGDGGRAVADGGVEAAWISSVVPGLTPRVVEAVRIATGVHARVVGPGTRTGLKLRTDSPQEVGADLVCQAVAARDLLARGEGDAGRPCIIVDSGAVLTLSAINAAGEFVGASIAPGLASAAEALKAVAAQIPEVRLEPPSRAIGRSTAQSVQSGIVYGWAGLVSGLVARIDAELGGGSVVLGTGEEEERDFLASCGVGRFVPGLVLEGLALIAAMER